MHPPASLMKTGVPPTALNARTGEETPPGMSCRALRNAASESEIERAVGLSGIADESYPERTATAKTRRTRRSREEIPLTNLSSRFLRVLRVFAVAVVFKPSNLRR